jgi:hypothetical protein
MQAWRQSRGSRNGRIARKVTAEAEVNRGVDDALHMAGRGFDHSGFAAYTLRRVRTSSKRKLLYILDWTQNGEKG